MTVIGYLDLYSALYHKDEGNETFRSKNNKLAICYYEIASKQ